MSYIFYTLKTCPVPEQGIADITEEKIRCRIRLHGIAIFPDGVLAMAAHNNPDSLSDALCMKHYFSATAPQASTMPVKSPYPPGLRQLEAESIHIMREALAESENPVMLYSIGKDSSVMLHLARKAFHPAGIPFPLLHVDTRWKFREMYLFRDTISGTDGIDLLVHINPEAVEKDINPFDHGSAMHTAITKTEALKQALDHYRFDVVFGGARRDEEKSRAKERIFSFRTSTHRWDPKNQRPELTTGSGCFPVKRRSRKPYGSAHSVAIP